MTIRFFKRGGLVVSAAGLALGAYLAGMQFAGNFHEVLPGELYRSNQPTAAQVTDYAQRYGIKTIVNLRGSAVDAQWYRDEIKTATALGVKHIDFRMSAYRPLTLDEARQLITLLRDAPKPVLIHCKSGADRTGLASVIYLSQVAGKSEDTAERQLSLYFGHLAIPFLSPAYAMDENWEELEKSLPVQSDKQS